MKVWHAKFLFFSVVFCLSHLVSVVRPQHCSATVFGTDLPETRSSSRTGLFINTQSPASCPGILTLWHYCFYNENAGKNGKTRFAIYRRDSGSNTKSYSKVYTEDQISVSIPSSPSFSCRTLTPSQSNFQVKPDDIIAACIHSSRPLDVLAETASGYRVYTPNWYCGSIPISISLYGDGVLGFAVHVYAEINECGVSNGGCAQVCTDLSVGYECSCNDGYTLDGDEVSCSDVDECAVNDGGCDHICDNDDGSFECHCNDGFLLEEDGLTCLSNGGSNTTGTIAGVVVVLFFIAIVISVGVLLIVVMYRRRRKSALPVSGNVQSVAANSVPSFKKSPGVQDQEANYELVGDEDSHLYGVLEPPDYGTVINEARQNHYVDNESPYQVPASDEEDIYAQLKQQCISRIPSGSIELNEHLGSGYFGTVDKGVWSHSKGTKEVAVKALKEDATRTDRVKFLQEAAIMGQFRHPSVIQLYGVAARGKTLMLVIELASKGDLKQLLHTMRQEHTPGQLAANGTSQWLLEYSQQTALGMDYLSGKGFVHRDLAARNILVSNNNVCKVADFGMSRDLADEDYYVSQGGALPVKWTAPEALMYKKYSTASDVWSYGCLLYEIWSLGHKPFESIDNANVVEKVTMGHRPAPPPGCPQKIYQLMIDCWHPVTSGRPSFREVVQALLEHEDSLLHIPPEALSSHSQAGMLGAPLEAGVLMYTDTQEMYLADGDAGGYEEGN